MGIDVRKQLDGNSVEAVINEIPREASIDHLWIRVRDLDEERRFYGSSLRA